ncbi:DUF6435 family protein [Endozoicomonas atrinae]|uniref:DUF6435 family protein n=1 Tax=Endozoicomonas atrinae TaxID=1333660 RepID=UPI000825DD11|nr:DUF6435 family protein [Endozoicomonas atrinae]
MFTLFSTCPTRQLRKDYNLLMERAHFVRDKGNISRYILLLVQAEKVWEIIEVLENGGEP